MTEILSLRLKTPNNRSINQSRRWIFILAVCRAGQDGCVTVHTNSDNTWEPVIWIR